MNRKALTRLAAKLGFPPGRWSDQGTGLKTQWASDQLVWLGWEEEGEALSSPWLQLEPDTKRGLLTWPQGSGGTPDTERYEDGAWELFDVWSDNSRPRRKRLSAWTARAATHVFDALGCLLCGQGLAKAKAGAHTEDGMHHVCVACWKALPSMEPTPRAWPLGNRRCRACGSNHGDDEPLFEGRHGKLCLPCRAGLHPPGKPASR